MLLATIMAQILTTISLFFLLFLAKTFIQTGDSQAQDNVDYGPPTTTYDEWYQSGMDSYTKEDWDDTIYYFEKALEEFKFYRKSLVECRLKCGKSRGSSLKPKDEGVVGEMQYFQGLFMKANCVRKCKLEKLGSRPELIDNDITDKFLTRMPYSYLQFAYYKNFDYEKAVAAAYTYLQWNADDEIMQNNLNYYQNLHGITEEHLVDLEEKLHHKYFMEGYRAHEKGEFPVVIEKMLKALEHYWEADEECRAYCEGKYENREFMDLYEAMANHYASVLFCKSQCEEWNSRMKGSIVDNYLPNHYHFLQYAYYKGGQLAEAANAGASFLVLVPNDLTMSSNMEFYEEEVGADKFAATPEETVQLYQQRKDLEQKMLQFAKHKFWGEEEQEYLEDLYNKVFKSMVYQDQAEPINPDEVLLGSTYPGQSYTDSLDGDSQELIGRPDEIWADFPDEEEEEEVGERRHFPETYFEKPEEVWPEDDEFEGVEEEEAVKEHSPEPGVLYSMEDAIRDMAADAEKDLAEQAKTKKNPSDSQTDPLPSTTGSQSDDFVDPNLGYRVDKHGVKWPDVKVDGPKVEEGVTKGREKPRNDKKKESRPADSMKTVRSKRAEMSVGMPTDKPMEGVSALDSLKKSSKTKEENLFPSGPPRAGPSIQGRRYAGEMEVEGDVEGPSYAPSLDGVKLYMNAGMLNGSKRVAADNMASQMECDNLIKLMDVEAKMGDGYEGKVYPHTKYESFEGITVSVAVNAAKVGRVPLVLPATYLHLAEKSRVFMKKYFNMKKELFFSYSHLVCRTAEPDSRETRTDFSHPIHADNCQLDEARVCHKTPPAFTWRDWSAVLYLNSDFAGGEFVFAHSNFSFQSQLKPKCGRLVGFSAGSENLHGVKAVLSGRRCALALWFTQNPAYQEAEFNKAAVLFRQTWEEQETIKKERASTKTEL